MDPQQYFSIFRSFVETSSLGYGFSDLDGNIIYANPALCRMIDVEKDEDMLGTNVASYYPQETQKKLVNEILPSVKQKGAWYGELLFQSCQGNIIHTIQNISLIRDENGKPLYFGNIITDITERKNVENALRENEERYRITAEKTGQMVYDYDVASQKIAWFGAVANITGYSLEEFQLVDIVRWSEMIHPEDRKITVELLDEAQKNCSTYDVEYRFARKDGTYIHIEDHGVYLPDKEGEAYRMLGTMADITERKEADEALRLTQFSVDNSSINIFWLNHDGRFVYVNDQSAKSLGYTKDELLNMHVWQIDPMMPKERWPAHWEELKSKKTLGFEMTHRRKDGSEFPVDIHSNYIQHAGKEYVFAFVRDIAESKKAKETLAEKENRFKTLFESASDAIFLMKDENFVDCNSATLKMFGCKRREIIGHTPIEFSPPAQPDGRKSDEKVLEKIKNAFSGHPQRFYWKHKQLDGTLFDAEVSLNLVELSNGPHLQAMVRDITERRKFEEDIQAKESFMTNIFSSTQDGISVLDMNMRIMRVNPKMEEWYAHKMPLVGKKCFTAYHGRSKGCEVCPTVQVLKNKKPAYEVVPKVGPNKNICGWLDLFAFPLLDSKTGEMLGVIEYVRDITERRQAEEDLRQALREKETLLNEVHHRVKNNLLTLYSLVNLQQISLRGKEENAERALEDTKQRISAMGRVHRMLYAAKNFSEIDFSEYIRSLVDEIKITYGTSECRIEVGSDLQPIVLNIDTAIPCGLIINELLVNAYRHAFPDQKEGRIDVSLRSRGKNIELKVQDDGIGIQGNPLLDQSKTLGLRLVTMLSQQLGGKISYKGKKGSLFTIVFKNATMKSSGND